MDAFGIQSHIISMKTLSYFERFVALNFSELRRFLVEGPATLFGKSIDRLSEQLNKTTKGQRIEKQINSYSYYLGGENWRNYSYKFESQDNPSFDERRTDLELYKSVCVFFDLFRNKKLDKSCTLDSLSEIVLGYRYPDEIVTRGITTSIQDYMFKVLFEYAGVDLSTCSKDDSQHVTFKDAKDLFINSHLSIDFKKNTKNLITFLQYVRNQSEHGHLTPEDGYEQVKMWVYSYIFIIYVIRRTFEKRDKYKNISEEYRFTLYVADGVSIYEKKKGKDNDNPNPIGIDVDKNSGRRYVRLLPFTKYRCATQGNDHKKDLLLDTFCQYGTIIPPVNSSNFRIMFENSILSSCAADNTDKALTKDLLEGINKIIDDKNKKWEERFAKAESGDPTSTDIDKFVKEINDETRTLIPLINANNKVMTDLNIQVNQLAEIIKLTGFDKFKENIADRIYTDPRASEWINVFSKQLAKHAKDSAEGHNLTHAQLDELIKLVNTLANNRHNKTKAKRIYNCVAGVVSIIAVILAGLSIYLRFGDNIPQSMYGLAFSCGNIDAAYKRAVILEKEKNHQEAAEWYMKARDRYAALLEDNPNDSIRASRLAEMTMRGKGGIIDRDTAEHYAHMAKRFDLEAYLATANGKYRKARDIINSYNGEKTAFLELADAWSGMLYSKLNVGFEDFMFYWQTIDSLASTNNIATEEALLVRSDVTLGGIQDNYGNYVVVPALCMSLSDAMAADVRYNSLTAQLILAEEYESMHMKKSAEYYRDKIIAIGSPHWVKSINEAPNNEPKVLLMRAQNNFSAGYTDYNMTAYYYHLADSIIRFRGNRRANYDNFCKDWNSLVVLARDLSDIDQIRQLVCIEYSDSIKDAIANYIMALKYTYTSGSGVSPDSKKSGDHLWTAAKLGLYDARVAYAILLDLDNDPNGMAILKRMTSGVGTSIHPYAARYILSKSKKENNLDLDLLKRMIAPGDTINPPLYDEYAHILRLNDVFNVSLCKLDSVSLRTVAMEIEIVLSRGTDHLGYLIGKLAEIEYALNNFHAANLYMQIMENAARELGDTSVYTSLWGISELARKRGDLETATSCAGAFAQLFFRESGAVLYEPARTSVLQHFHDLYPEILDLVKEKTGHDFLKGEWLFNDVGFDRERDFSKYESPVKRLEIELPDYVEPAYPVTGRYFD